MNSFILSYSSPAHHILIREKATIRSLFFFVDFFQNYYGQDPFIMLYCVHVRVRPYETGENPMTDNQKLDLILSEITGMKSDMQGMKTDMQSMKSDMQNVKSDMQGMKTDMQSMKTDLQGMKTDMQGMKTDMQDMKDGMQNMQTDIQDIKTDIKDLRQRVSNIEVHLENVTDKNIMLLAENFIDLTNKLNQAVPAADKNRAYEVKVNYVLEEIDKLKQNVSKLMGKPA